MTVFSNAEAIARIRASVYNPKDPLWRTYFSPIEKCVGWQEAIVVDNKDPDGLGRLRVHFPMWGDDVVTGWIPLIRPFGGKDMGMFMLPDIKQRVLCLFINYNPSCPVAFGGYYTHQDKSPAGTNKGNDRKIFRSPTGSTVIFDDKKGGERIEISMMDGKMRMVLDPQNGIEIVNELGDIEIKCQNLTIEGEDAGEFIFKKDLTIEADSIDIKSDKGIAVKGKTVNIKGKIDLKANGVLAGGKQMAKKNDQVVGIDKHDIMVPSPSGLVTVPMIPHPYIGKLVDKLSDDVKIGGIQAAMKGSKSKNNAPMHLPMPPGVQFKKAPNNEGEVTLGTIPKVKINGKEAAVLGSKVKTCSDPMDMENCQIIAMGVAVKLPIEIPVTNPIERSLSNPKWDKAKAGIGEIVKLSVQLKKQYEYATVEFKIFPEGADTKNSQPIQKVYGRNEGGKAEVEWITLWPQMGSDNEETDSVKYIFTAASFGCEEVKGGSISVEKENLEIVLKDKKTGDPIPGVKYIAKFEDGTKREGELDEKGFSKERDIPKGKIKVIFETGDELIVDGQEEKDGSEA